MDNDESRDGITMPNRTVCGVLQEMRRVYETRNFASLLGLIEEVQSMANRMEARLYDLGDYEDWQENYEILKADIKKLRKERDDLNRGIRKIKRERPIDDVEEVMDLS